MIPASSPAPVPTPDRPDEAPGPTPAVTAPARRIPVLGRLSYVGLVGALLGFFLALTPSLLPRPALFLGALAGVGTALGYGVGAWLAAVGRWLGVPSASPGAARLAWRVLAVVAPVALVVSIWLAAFWQGQVRELVGQSPQRIGIVVTVLVALVLAVLLLLVGRGLRGATRWVSRLVGRILPARFATVVAVVLVLAIGYVLVTDVAFRGFTSLADRTYSGTNATTPAGAVQPAVPERSGGPGSLASWDSLGRQGRAFVGRGPSVTQLSAFSGRPAKEPIRVYVGLGTAPSARQRAALAVDELRRTGAFDRAVLVVAGATGTGWIEPQAVDSLEYLWNGDTAFVTIQYSYLPSWISVLVDRQRAGDAGRELFDAVFAAWSGLPPDHRPKLLSYGLSLGAYAAQSAFATAGDIAARTQGALYVGPPSFAEPWGTIIRARDAGSPQWQPVYRDGVTVRFASTPGDITADSVPAWTSPRVLYLQHGSDPVVWWTPHLLFQRPDWLTERRAPDVSPNTRWIPVVTFFQVTVDQFFGTTVPAGHGHNYYDAYVDGWISLAQPPDVTPAQVDRLRQLIVSQPAE